MCIWKTRWVNTPVALGVTFYVAQLFMIEDCKDVRFETVTAYTAWGITLRAYNNENLYFKPFSEYLQARNGQAVHGVGGCPAPEKHEG